MKISYTKVTWYSQLAAIVIFLAVYFLGFYVGEQYVLAHNAPQNTASASASDVKKLLNNVTFVCPSPGDDAYIAAQFLQDASGKGSADLELFDGRTMSLPQTISADGARYANADGSFVFWNKGNGAFIMENGTTTYSSCVAKLRI